MALELTSDDASGIWGLVRQTTYYSLWTLLPGGMRYPLQVDREWNGVGQSSATIVRIDVNPTIDASSFGISDEARKAFAALPAVYGIPALALDTAKRAEIAPGIAHYSGSWNVGMVRQPDGVVITRERLDVARSFGFHAGLTPWTVIEVAISAASASSPPAR